MLMAEVSLTKSTSTRTYTSFNYCHLKTRAVTISYWRHGYILREFVGELVIVAFDGVTIGVYMIS